MKGMGFWTTAVTVFMLALAVTFAVILVRLGFSDFAGTDASSEIVTTAVAGVGGLLAGLTSAVGMLLKHSMDVRNTDLKNQAEKRLEIDSERNNNLRQEAESRLKLEAAIQAVGLLSTSAGEEAPETQRAGVLFTLANLGMMDLALTLFNQMASTGKIDAATADYLIGRGLQSDNETTIRTACDLLDKYADTLLVTDDACFLPLCIHECDPKLPGEVRLAALCAIMAQLMSRPYSTERMENIGRFTIRSLTTWWWDEPDEHLRHGAGICLDRLHHAYQLPAGAIVLGKDGRSVKAHEAKEAVSGLTRKSVQTHDALVALWRRLGKWIETGTSESGDAAQA